MNLDPEERMNKILKYGGAGLAALLILGVFAWRLDVDHRRAALAESDLAGLRQEMDKVMKAPNPDAVTKGRLIGKWECREADRTTRTLAFNLNGPAEYYAQNSARELSLNVAERGPWDVKGDILYIDVRAKDMDTYYLRIIRLTQDKLVIRNHLGTERVYDRVK